MKVFLLPIAAVVAAAILLEALRRLMSILHCRPMQLD